MSPDLNFSKNYNYNMVELFRTPFFFFSCACIYVTPQSETPHLNGGPTNTTFKIPSQHKDTI